MDKEKQLKSIRSGLQEAVDFYSAANKGKREVWVGSSFIRNLNIAFQEDEVRSSADEPPDVVFRDALFEIKELMDVGRKRHDEYRELLRRAIAATDPHELVDAFAPEDISPEGIAKRISEELKKLDSKYPEQVRKSLDLLFYVNLQGHFFADGPMPENTQLAKHGWRSVSALFGNRSLVFYAESTAPQLLKDLSGSISERR